MVGVAAMLHAADGIIDQARLVLTGMADKPVRAAAAEAVLVGSAADPATLEEAAAVAAADLDPPSDLHGSTAYRRHVGRRPGPTQPGQAAAEIGTAAMNTPIEVRPGRQRRVPLGDRSSRARPSPTSCARTCG